MTYRKVTVDLPVGDNQTTTEFDVIGESPVDSSFLRIKHAEASVEIQADAEAFFDAFTRFAQYDQWTPAIQGSAHWLTVREGDSGARFIAYDKLDHPFRALWRSH